MSLVLNIDTSGNDASVSLAKSGTLLLSLNFATSGSMAKSLHLNIEKLFADTGEKLSSLDAVAIVSGPGSYTGLRVGMACAKGLCYSLNKPLITVGTLEVLAKAAILEMNGDKKYLYCPMIDARRMEVFAALYGPQLETIFPPQAIILQKGIFNNALENNQVVYVGSGIKKWAELNVERLLIFLENVNISAALNSISHEKFRFNIYTDLIHSEPTYLKEFYEG